MEKIQRGERAEQTGLQPQNERVINVRPVVHAPRGKNRQRSDDGRKQHHEQAEAVHAEEILDAERRHPVEFFDELQSAVLAVEMQPHAERTAESDQAGRQREAANKIFPFRAEAGDGDAAEERNER